MEGQDALIGYTGFVGQNLSSQQSFAHLYNSKNIDQIHHQEFGLVICAGTSSVKWLANKDPSGDLEQVQKLINSLEFMRARHFVLISTIDVYPSIRGVDEDSPIAADQLLPYSRHRKNLEDFVKERFSSTIIRLPGLFGKGLKKNMLYDFLNGSWQYIHPDGLMQFYNLNYLWRDIQKSLEHNLRLVNFSTEPVSVKEVAKEVFDIHFNRNGTRQAPYYDMRSKYASIWGRNSPYLYSKSEVMEDMKSFVAGYDSRDRSSNSPSLNPSHKGREDKEM